MLSLSRAAQEQAIADQNMAETLRVSTRPPVETPPFHENRDRLGFCLQSTDLALVEFGLCQFPLGIARDRKCLQLLPDVTVHLRSPSRVIECRAATAIVKACRVSPRVVAAQAIAIVMERIAEYPAVEYVEILCMVLPYLTEGTMTSCVIPSILKFLELSESHQFAFGEILSRVSPKAFRVGPDLLMKVLTSEVLINTHLPKLIADAMKAGVVSDEWVNRTYADAMMRAGEAKPALRPGVIRTIVSFVHILPQKSLLEYVTTGLRWAEDDDNVGIAILSRADDIVTPKTVELFSVICGLLGRIARNGVVSARRHLPKIIACNSTMFNMMTTGVSDIIIGIGKDPAPEVRMAFVDNFLELFVENKGQVFQDSLCDVLSNLFCDSCLQVRTRLCSSILYSSLGPTRLFPLVPKFLDCVSTITRWREIEASVRTYVAFPPSVLAASWDAAVPVVFAAVEKYPQALTSMCYTFCSRLLSAPLDPVSQKAFVDVMITRFARHEKFSMRQMFPKLASACVTRTQVVEIVDKVYSEVETLARDPVASVRAAVIGCLYRIRRYYQTQSNPRETVVLNLFMSFSDSSDPYIREVWTEHWTCLNRAMRSLPKLEDGQVEKSKSCLLKAQDLRRVTVGLPSFASEGIGAQSGMLQSIDRMKAKAQAFRKSHGVTFGSSSCGLPTRRKHL